MRFVADMRIATIRKDERRKIDHLVEIVLAKLYIIRQTSIPLSLYTLPSSSRPSRTLFGKLPFPFEKGLAPMGMDPS